MYVNPNIRDTKRVFPMQGRGDYLRLDMNENPNGLPEDFVREVLSEVTPEFLAMYPEPERFHRQYADHIGAEPEQIAVTNGTDMAIRYILETFGEYGKDVVTVSPTFEMYRINCSLLGLAHRPIPYRDDMSIDAEAVAAAITEATRIVVLVNPNNPIGDLWAKEDFESIRQRADKVGALVLVDEAYHYFTDYSLLSYALEKENVLLMRTFSKLMSIPALRLGTVIGHPKLIRYLRQGQLSFDVNSPALLFGERLLMRPDIIRELISVEKAGKDWLCEQLADAGYSYIKCAGNHVLIRTRRNAHDVEERLRKEHRILVHSYGDGILRDYIRVTTACISVMEQFWRALTAVE